jgi:methylated-DNA-[protein]-cysteine S-methyltransferase
MSQLATVHPEQEVESLRVLLPSPIGEIGLELSDSVVTHLVIAPKGREKARFTPFSRVPGSDFLDEVFGRLSEYFAGARPSPDLEYDLGPAGLSGFARRVLKETAKVPYGKTRTYRKIAAAAGRPDAYRLVLATLVANPIPILIPCHRIVTNKSGIGSYTGGKDRKRWLLTMERESLKAEAV